MALNIKCIKKLKTLLTVNVEGRQSHVMLAHLSYFSVAALHIEMQCILLLQKEGLSFSISIIQMETGEKVGKAQKWSV
jgi:hypothetical protein